MRQMGADGLDQRLADARRSASEGRWRAALDLLAADDASSSAECLELRAEAAYGAGDFEVCVQAWEDLHSLQVSLGEPVEAARAAAMIAMYLMMDTGLMAPVRGWLRSADRHLEGVGDHPVRAIVAMVRAYERFMCGAMDEARANSSASRRRS
jgi:hypothetical protein